MESQSEIRRNQSNRAIALIISLVIHLVLAYFIFGAEPIIKDSPTEVVQLSKGT